MDKVEPFIEAGDLPDSDQHLLLKLSGGVDSSIVYYALCEKFKDRDNVKIVLVTLDTDIKNQTIATAQRIIQIVGNLTGKYPIDHITKKVKDSELMYTKGQEQLTRIAYKTYPINKMYSGITINPNVKSFRKFVKKNYKTFGFDLPRALGEIKIRDKTRDVYKPHPTFDESGFIFAAHDKKFVKELYVKYDMMEKLYPYTFSCVSPPYKIENNIPIHCGNCWSCLERLYAFGRIV